MTVVNAKKDAKPLSVDQIPKIAKVVKQEGRHVLIETGKDRGCWYLLAVAKTTDK